MSRRRDAMTTDEIARAREQERARQTRRRAGMSAEDIDRAREQDRLRQARRRARVSAGDKLVLLPADIADELGDDEEVAARAIAILRRHLAKGKA